MVARLTKPRIFVIMPFGQKPDENGHMIDFNAVYEDLFAQVDSARYHIHRADRDDRPGNILQDMFKDILLADLVIVDCSIDNANVWYELGVRHALQSSGALLVKGTDRKIPFDVAPDRIFSYSLTDAKKGSARVPASPSEDAEHIGRWLDMLADGERRTDSPVYHNLSGLPEPDIRSLRMPSLEAQWAQLDKYVDLIDIARKDKRPGDILTLASMPPNRALECEALKKAGRALSEMGRYKFAKDTLEEALELEPSDPEIIQQIALAENRMGLSHDAEARLSALARTDGSGETLGLLGRVAKDRWRASFQDAAASEMDDLRDAATDHLGRLLLAAQAYLKAFKSDPSDHFPDINAPTMAAIYRHLCDDEDWAEAELGDIDALAGGVAWALECAMDAKKTAGVGLSFWDRATEAELALVSKAKDSRVIRRYRKVAQAADATWFSLDSARQQLVLLRQVGFRRDLCDEIIAKLTAERDTQDADVAAKPFRQVVLFAGHMVDANDRATPRFPAAKEAEARARISAALDALDLSAEDHVVTGAACGGDLLFLEEARARGASATVLLPQERSRFLSDSVTFADRDAGGTRWQDSFKAIERDEAVEIREQSEELGAAIELDPERKNPFRIYERNTIWLIYTALAMKADATHLLLLWDGKGGDGAGGTSHMAAEMERITGEAPRVIDPATL